MLFIKKLFPMLWPTLRRALSRLGGARADAAFTPVPRANRAWWMQRHAEKVREASGGPFDLVLVGDSITHFWETTGRAVWAQHFGALRTLNLGFDGDFTEHVLWRIQHGEWPASAPRLTVLLAGTNNNTRYESPASTAAGLRAVLRAIRQATPEADLVLLCLFPRNRPDSWTRRRTIEVNALLPAIAREENVRLHDLGHLFVDEQGRLDRTTMPDQLHPSEEGYRRWAEALLKLAAKRPAY